MGPGLGQVVLSTLVCSKLGQIHYVQQVSALGVLVKAFPFLLWDARDCVGAVLVRCTHSGL